MSEHLSAKYSDSTELQLFLKTTNNNESTMPTCDTLQSCQTFMCSFAWLKKKISTKQPYIVMSTIAFYFSSFAIPYHNNYNFCLIFLHLKIDASLNQDFFLTFMHASGWQTNKKTVKIIWENEYIECGNYYIRLLLGFSNNTRFLFIR